MEECVAGESRCVLISGEAGIGKSALLDALADMASETGLTVLAGRGFDGASTSPLWPIRSALREYIAKVDPGDLENQLGPGIVDMVGPIPQIAEKFPNVAADHSLGLTNQGRFRFFESFGAFLHRTAEKSGVLLVIDDFQWSDAVTKQLTEFLATAGQVPRILLVCAVRDPGIAWMERSRHEASFSSIHLSGLDEDSVTELVFQSRGNSLTSTDALEIQARADGNPLFVKELTKHIQPDRQENAQSVPESIVQIINRRLDGLGSLTTRVLRACAVIGSEFSVDEALRSIRSTDREDLLDALESGVREHLITWRVVNRRCAFASHLIRDAVALGLTHADRASIHAKIFVALAEEKNSSSDHGRLIHHLLRAGSLIEPDNLARWTTVLGERALDQYDFNTAAALFSHAAGRLAESGNDPVGVAGMKFGEARALHGLEQMDGAKEALSESFDLFASAGEIRSAVQVACYPVGPGQTGSPDLTTKALERLPVEPSIDSRVLAHAALHAAEIRGNDARSQALFAQAMSIAQETNNELLRMWILAWAGHVDLYQARPGECIVKHREALDLNVQIGDPFVEIYTGFCVVSAGLSIGETSLALEAARRMSRESHRARYRPGLITGCRNEAAVYAFTGRWTEARATLKRGLALAPGNLGLNLFGLMVERITGNEDGCEAHETAVARIASKSLPGPINLLNSVAMSHANSKGFGAHIDSGSLRESGLGVLSSVHASVPAVFAMANAALALASVNESDSRLAQEVFEPLGKVAEVYPFLEPAHVCLLRLQMLIAHELGDQPEVEARFQKCIQFLEKAGFEPELAAVLFEHASQSRGISTYERLRLAHKARDITARLGMRPLQTRLDQLVTRLDPRRHEPAKPGDLTAREVEIAQLVAEGRSNPEIAAELVISPHTARKHVSNILGKLDLANRTELARHVLESGHPG